MELDKKFRQIFTLEIVTPRSTDLAKMPRKFLVQISKTTVLLKFT